MHWGQTRVAGHMLPCPVLHSNNLWPTLVLLMLLTCRLGLGWGWVGSVGDENVGGGGSGS